MLINKSKVVLSMLLLIGLSFCSSAGFLDSFNDALDTFNSTHDTYKETRESVKDAKNTAKHDTTEVITTEGYTKGVFTTENQTTENFQPHPEPISFYIAINNEQQGPFSLDVLKNQIIDKEIDKNTLVWKEGMSGWTKAGDVPVLNSLFKAIPPPLPSPSLPPPLP